MPGTGVIDRFLADIVDRGGSIRIQMRAGQLPNILGMLFMLARLRVKAFPKVLAIVESILGTAIGQEHRADIVTHLEEYLVPGHRGIDRLKLRKIGGLDDQLDGTRLAGNAADQPAPFQGHDHVVHGRRGDSEESLEVCLGRRLSVEQGVCVNERQVLTLLFCKWRGGFSGHGIENLIKDLHEYTVSRDADRG